MQNMSEGERTHSYKYKMKVGAIVVLQYPYSTLRVTHEACQ